VKFWPSRRLSTKRCAGADHFAAIDRHEAFEEFPGSRHNYAFVIVRLDRRDIIWINVTRSPTAEWVARQIMEAFPWDEAPKYLIRDRDRIYGSVVARRLRAMGIRDKPTAASPWQNGFAERLIGSIRRGCVWTTSLSWARRSYAVSCDPMLAITTISERIGHWTKMRQSLAEFSRPEASDRIPS
jgi:hypothetical protein